MVGIVRADRMMPKEYGEIKLTGKMFCWSLHISHSAKTSLRSRLKQVNDTLGTLCEIAEVHTIVVASQCNPFAKGINKTGHLNICLRVYTIIIYRVDTLTYSLKYTHLFLK